MYLVLKIWHYVTRGPTWRKEYLKNYELLEKETERRNKELRAERKEALTLIKQKNFHILLYNCKSFLF